jgi:hypothetical protein
MTTLPAVWPASCTERSVENRLSVFFMTLWLCVATSGCAWDAGQPWGIADAKVRLRSSVPADRLTNDGRMRTASEYLWKIESLQVELAGTQLLLAGDAGALSFDPAKPPAGYSNCHGGHCHTGDGRLVDYADIQAELLGSAAGAEVVDLALLATPTLAPAYGPSLQAATADLPIGELSTFKLAWRGVTLHAHVWDGSPSAKRLPPEGVDVQIRLGPSSVAAQVSGSVGPHQPLHVQIAADLDVPVLWLDGLDVAKLAGTSTLLDLPADHPAAVALQQAWQHHASLSAQVSRAE